MFKIDDNKTKKVMLYLIVLEILKKGIIRANLSTQYSVYYSTNIGL